MISFYEQGKNKLTNDRAKRLCEFYQLNYKFLTGEKRIYAKKETIKNNDVDEFKDSLLEKFEKIYKEEIKNLKTEALKRTYKRLKKEL